MSKSSGSGEFFGILFFMGVFKLIGWLFKAFIGLIVGIGILFYNAIVICTRANKRSDIKNQIAKETKVPISVKLTKNELIKHLNLKNNPNNSNEIENENKLILVETLGKFAQIINKHVKNFTDIVNAGKIKNQDTLLSIKEKNQIVLDSCDKVVYKLSDMTEVSSVDNDELIDLIIEVQKNFYILMTEVYSYKNPSGISLAKFFIAVNDME